VRRRLTTICFRCLIFLSHGQWCAAATMLTCIRSVKTLGKKRHETNFLFFISRLALIDAILLTGIAFHQIR
jgi:hypothetical protein